jgi:hypothetical protein
MRREPNKYIAKNMITGKPQWIGVDFDNTVSRMIWPEDGCGEAIPGAIDSLQRLQDQGWKICIYTARPWTDHIALEQWFKDQGFQPDNMLFGKPLLRLMVDDSAYRFQNWSTDLPQIEEILGGRGAR